MRIEKISNLEYKVEYTEAEVAGTDLQINAIFARDIDKIVSSSEAKAAIADMHLPTNSHSALYDERERTLHIVIARPREDDFIFTEYLRGIYCLNQKTYDEDDKEYLSDMFDNITADRSCLLNAFAEKEIDLQRYGLYLANEIYSVELEMVGFIESFEEDNDPAFVSAKNVFLNHMVLLSRYIMANTFALKNNVPLKYVEIEPGAITANKYGSQKVSEQKVFYTKNIDDVISAAKVIRNNALVFSDNGYWILGEFSDISYAETNLNEVYNVDYETKLAYFTEHETKCLGTINSLCLL